MDDRTTVAMCKAINHLSENGTRFSLCKTSFLLHKLKQVTSGCKFKDHVQVLLGFKYFEEPNDVFMTDSRHERYFDSYFLDLSRLQS